MLDVRLLLLLNPWLTVEMYLIQICFITLQDFIWTGRIVSSLISWDRVTNFNIFLLFLVTPGFFKLALSESLLKEIKPREPWEILSLKHKIITKMHWKFHSPMEKSQTFSFEKKTGNTIYTTYQNLYPMRSYDNLLKSWFLVWLLTINSLITGTLIL